MQADVIGCSALKMQARAAGDDKTSTAVHGTGRRPWGRGKCETWDWSGQKCRHDGVPAAPAMWIMPESMPMNRSVTVSRAAISSNDNLATRDSIPERAGGLGLAKVTCRCAPI